MNIHIDKANKEDIVFILELLKELYIELGEEAESVKFLNEQFIHFIFITIFEKWIISYF